MIRSVLAAFTLAVLPAAAQDQLPATQNISAQETPWQLTCTAAPDTGMLDCTLQKSLIRQHDGQILAQAAVVNGDTLTMRLLAPHGLALTEGLTVSVDGEAVAQPAFISSLPGGLVATLELTPEIEGKLRFGRALQVEGTQTGGGAFSFQMSLTGFAPAVAKLR